MAFEFLTNVPLEQALNEYKKLLSQNGFGCAQEKIPVTESCGRITSHAVYAHICAPHYHASAMDGIALRAKDTFELQRQPLFALRKSSLWLWTPEI